jgi:hypothetical protein
MSRYGRDECQVCERKQALNKHGTLVNHGYQRPGWGYLEGGCAGVKHKPFPETDALEAYIPHVKHHKARVERDLKEAPGLETLRVKDERLSHRGEFLDLYPLTKEEAKEFARLNKLLYDDDATEDSGARTALYRQYSPLDSQRDNWERHLRFYVHDLETDLRYTKEEVKRVSARIAKGKKLQ